MLTTERASCRGMVTTTRWCWCNRDALALYAKCAGLLLFVRLLLSMERVQKGCVCGRIGGVKSSILELPPKRKRWAHQTRTIQTHIAGEMIRGVSLLALLKNIIKCELYWLSSEILCLVNFVLLFLFVCVFVVTMRMKWTNRFGSTQIGTACV